jgi:4-diphosphocytidyl-2-C-methyl-D-erythritol kinase
VPLVELAPAKLNLSLEVTGRRADGYHDLATLFQTVGLADELYLSPADELTLECDRADLAGDVNLALRAARALRARLGTAAGARLTLRKRIPVAAGLGGGSSDAAAAIRGLSRLWGAGLARGDLLRLARALGADVPFLLWGGTALATGVGDQIDWLPDRPERFVVLYTPASADDRDGADRPALADKTARAYRALARDAWSDGAATRALAADPAADLARAPNAFESVAGRLYPGFESARERLLAAGAPWARLTGAGPTLFSVLPSEAAARRVLAAIGEPDRALVVPTLPRLPDWLT